MIKVPRPEADKSIAPLAGLITPGEDIVNIPPVVVPDPIVDSGSVPVKQKDAAE